MAPSMFGKQPTIILQEVPMTPEEKGSSSILLGTGRAEPTLDELMRKSVQLSPHVVVHQGVCTTTEQMKMPQVTRAKVEELDLFKTLAQASKISKKKPKKTSTPSRSASLPVERPPRAPSPGKQRGNSMSRIEHTDDLEQRREALFVHNNPSIADLYGSQELSGSFADFDTATKSQSKESRESRSVRDGSVGANSSSDDASKGKNRVDDDTTLGTFFTQEEPAPTKDDEEDMFSVFSWSMNNDSIVSEPARGSRPDLERTKGRRCSSVTSRCSSIMSSRSFDASTIDSSSTGPSLPSVRLLDDPKEKSKSKRNSKKKDKKEKRSSRSTDDKRERRRSRSLKVTDKETRRQRLIDSKRSHRSKHDCDKSRRTSRSLSKEKLVQSSRSRVKHDEDRKRSSRSLSKEKLKRSSRSRSTYDSEERRRSSRSLSKEKMKRSRSLSKEKLKRSSRSKHDGEERRRSSRSLSEEKLKRSKSVGRSESKRRSSKSTHDDESRRSSRSKSEGKRRSSQSVCGEERTRSSRFKSKAHRDKHRSSQSVCSDRLHSSRSKSEKRKEDGRSHISIPMW